MSDPVTSTDGPAASPARIVISVDAMGGDNGAEAVVAGIADSAARNRDVGFIVHGDADELTRLIAKR